MAGGKSNARFRQANQEQIMKVTKKTIRTVGVLLLAGLCLLAWPAAAELSLPTLTTKRGIYTNVVITAKTERDIYIRHDGGIGNIKLADIEDDEALIALGLKAPPVKVEVAEPTTGETANVSTSAPSAQESQVARYQALALEKLKELKKYQPSMTVAGFILSTLLIMYLFGCYCLRLICVKAGHPPGFLIWIPLLQMIPAFRAAGMSGWWFLALFVPLLNLVAQIIWCFKITSARGKSIWVAILLLLPVFSLFAFLYLAFSSSGEET